MSLEQQTGSAHPRMFDRRKFIGAAGVAALGAAALELGTAKTVEAATTGVFWDQGGAVYNVMAYGAKGDGVTDDTAAIQAAINALPAVSYFDGSSNFFGTNASVVGRAGALYFPTGIYLTSGVLTLPPGVIRITGAGTQMWGGPGVTAWGSGTQLGGSVIACTNPVGGVLTTALSPSGYPATTLFLDGIEMRAQSPATPQPGAAPVINLDAMIGGAVRNLTVQEVKTSGGIGNNLNYIFTCRPGDYSTERLLENITAFGGTRAFSVNGAHLRCRSVSAGGTSNSAVDGTYNRAFEIGFGYEQSFDCLHPYSATWGVAFSPYPYSTLSFIATLRTVHFEALGHYLLPLQAPQSMVLMLEDPTWDVPGLSPASDVAASIAPGQIPNISAQKGYFIFSRNEQNPRSLSGWRLAAPGSTNSSWTAGTSPYTFGPLGYDANFVISMIGGMTGLTLDGQALRTTVDTAVYVPAGHSLTATWAVTAPVLKVLPV